MSEPTKLAPEELISLISDAMRQREKDVGGEQAKIFMGSGGGEVRRLVREALMRVECHPGRFLRRLPGLLSPSSSMLARVQGELAELLTARYRRPLEPIYAPDSVYPLFAPLASENEKGRISSFGIYIVEPPGEDDDDGIVRISGFWNERFSAACFVKIAKIVDHPKSIHHAGENG